MTAVEFIVEQLAKNGVLHSSDIAKAKEMEVVQIMNAVLYGFRRDSDGDDWQGDNYNAEKYYNETFKSE